ncbi:MAG: hypothetical protein M3Z04_01280 [Chloroflexota bacterium]|nr:hypothetical protein [Chloroflexota bacterium]
MARRKPRTTDGMTPVISDVAADEREAREAARLYDAALTAGDEPDGQDLARISESVLARDWLMPEEDIAWHDLSKAT